MEAHLDQSDAIPLQVVRRLACVALAVCCACDVSGSDKTSDLSVVTVPLQSTDAHGRVFRITGAVAVTGPESSSLVVDISDLDAGNEVLTFTPTVGLYTVTLSDYALYQRDPDTGVFRLRPDAVAIAPLSQQVQVRSNAHQTVRFVFRVPLFETCAPFEPGCLSDVGIACDDALDCASVGPDAFCLDETSSGIAGGYCTGACGTTADCPNGSECLGALCLLPCDSGGMCSAGAACFAFEGPGVCLPVCSTDDDCTGTNTCNTGSGFCEDICGADDVTCDGNDDDCDGNIDEGFATNFGGDVSCGGDSCFEVGSLVCVGGVVADTCGAPAPGCTQETACGDATDNDSDGFADCDDPDCEQTPACLASASPVGGRCSVDGDCRSVRGPAVCLPSPGGYCSNFCDEMDPSTCPDNAACITGVCLATCNPNDSAAACPRPEHVCLLQGSSYACVPPP